VRLVSFRSSGLLAVAVLIASAVPAAAQNTGTIEGTILSAADQAPVEGATVLVSGHTHRALTDARGRFRLAGVPAGDQSLVVQRIGFRESTRQVAVTGGAVQQLTVSLTEAAALIDPITVTASRGNEEQLKELPVTVSVLSGEEIADMRPTHVSEVLNRLPGVHIVAFDGADMHAAVRYPLGPKATALYMEDGIPFAPSSFYAPAVVGAVGFASSGQIEALKGPGTAAYGSDAVTGVVNFVTAAPPLTPAADFALEAGPHDYRRALLSAGGTFGRHGLLLTGTFADQDGRNSDPSRQLSGNARWNATLPNGALLRTVVSYTRRDARMAAGQDPDQFARRIFVNPYPVAFDDWTNVRASASYQQAVGRTTFRVTPYVRYQDSDRVPSWMLSYDPVVWDIDYRSAGLLAQVGHQFSAMNALLTAGVDADYSPLDRRVPVVTPVAENGQWVGMSLTAVEPHYDYRATYRGGAAYGQVEFDPVRNLRLSVGARFDASGYDYHTRLAARDTGNFRRPADTGLRYDKLTPKLGFTYSLSEDTRIFGSYRRGFRVPLENQLFSQESSESSIDLKPVEVESYEMGFRAGNERARIEVSGYYMELHNDIINYRAASNVSALTNNGETSHRGIEITGGVAFTSDLRAELAYTYARHRFESYQPSSDLDFSGREMDGAPHHLVNGTLTYQPRLLNGGRIQAEWSGMSSYWLDPGNTIRFDGYDIFHLRASYVVARRLELFARLMNLTDETYSVQSFVGYGDIPWNANPGEYRSLYVGAQARLW